MTETNVSAVITTPESDETALEAITRVARKINETALHGQDAPAIEPVRFIRISEADLDDLRRAFERHEQNVDEIGQFYAQPSHIVHQVGCECGEGPECHPRDRSDDFELPCTCGLPATDTGHAEQHQRVLADDAQHLGREAVIADLDARAEALDQANP